MYTKNILRTIETQFRCFRQKQMKLDSNNCFFVKDNECNVIREWWNQK